MQLIDTGALPAIAWKNGGGTTRTLAVSPESAGFDDFIWRVSIADVQQSGSFSLFPGVDRTILLLNGAGMTLRRSDGSSHALTTPYEPHALRGEDPIEAFLVDGASQDFNLMVRRGKASTSLKVWRGEDSVPRWTGSGLFYCARGDFNICVDGDPVSLTAGWACTFSGVEDPVRIAPKNPDAVLIGALLELPESEE